jgi:hypothetical protein
MIEKASKASSKYHVMEAPCGDPESIGTSWVEGSDLLDVFGNEVGIFL